MSARKDGMKILKSIKSTKIIFLLLVVFLTATVTEVLCDVSYGVDKVTVIGKCAPCTNSSAENNVRIKFNFLEIIFKHQWFCDSSPASNYSYICMESWSPRDIHLPAKSDRAPPEAISS